MAQIVTITNPLTGQPAQVDQLEHTAQQIDDATARAIPGGAIDIDLSNKMGGIESAEYPGCYYRMAGSEKEWINPPMVLGEEYRTTKRYNNKAVYEIALESGALIIPGTTDLTGTWDTKCTVINTQITIVRPDGSCSTSPNFEDSTIYARHWTRANGTLAIKAFNGLPTGTTVKAVISYVKN